MTSELERVDEEFEWDPTVFHAEPGAAWYLPAPDEDAPLQLPEAFNLLGAHTDFFGHWMCEYLPKYAAAALTGALPRMPVLIDAHMPAAHRQSLELLFPEQEQIIEIEAFRSVLVQRLWVAPDLSYYPLYDSGTGRFEWDAISVAPERIAPIMEELRRRADARLPPSPTSGREGVSSTQIVPAPPAGERCRNPRRSAAPWVPGHVSGGPFLCGAGRT